MSFGLSSLAYIPTAQGDFDIHVLPELIDIGSRENQRVVTFAEHYAMMPTHFNKNEPATFHIHRTNLQEDFFKPAAMGELGLPRKTLKQISDTKENSILIYIDKLSADALRILQAGLGTTAEAKQSRTGDIAGEFARRFELSHVPQMIFTRQSQMRATTGIPAPHNTLHLSRLDEAVDVPFPEMALAHLFLGLKPSDIIFRKHLSHYALSIETPADERASFPLVRVHSSCATGDINDSHKCDCGPQFRMAVEEITKHGGMVVYHNAEGRGVHSLAVKMHFYRAAMEYNLDTYAAMEHFGYSRDVRSYDAAAELLRREGITAVTLLTNNPTKMKGLRAAGITIDHTQNVHVHDLPPDRVRYLTAKSKLGGHDFGGLLTQEQN